MMISATNFLSLRFPLDWIIHRTAHLTLNDIGVDLFPLLFDETLVGTAGRDAHEISFLIFPKLGPHHAA